MTRVGRITKQANVKLTAPRVPRGAVPPADDLSAIDVRARLSLEGYRYTQDDYWLECAFDDCRKGALDWNRLCEHALGGLVPPPKRANGPPG